MTVHGQTFGNTETVGIHFGGIDVADAFSTHHDCSVTIQVPGAATPGAHLVTAVGCQSKRTDQPPFTVTTPPRDHSQPGDVSAVYQAFRRDMMPVDAALQVLADLGAIDDPKQPTLTPLGRWARQRLRPASAEWVSAAELLTALASLDELEAAALAKQWFESRPLSGA